MLRKTVTYSHIKKQIYSQIQVSHLLLLRIMLILPVMHGGYLFTEFAYSSLIYFKVD